GLARWWMGRDMLHGGNLAARYTMDLPSDAPDRLDLAARVRLADANPVLPQGTLPFPESQARIDTLTGDVRYRNGTLAFNDAVWTAPAFRVAGTGTVTGENVDGNFRLTTGRWRELAGDLARALPASGGELTVTTHLSGPVSRLTSSPVSGMAELRGVR